MTIKAIVAATDGSEESLRAVEWAAAEALPAGLPLRIVSAMSLLPWTIPLQLRPDRDHIADLIRSEREQALKAAAAMAATRAPGLVISTDPLEGPPAQALTKIGSSASMLVVGSRGVGAFTAMTLGSVSRYVSAHAGCPVVVVRDPPAVPHGQVVVGVGDPDDCADALAFGFEEADLRQASLLAVHAWPVPGPVPGRRLRRPGGSAADVAGEVSRRPGRPGGPARPPRPGPGGPVCPRRPGGDRAAGAACAARRPARSRRGQERRAEPRARPRRHRPVVV